jgi:methyltransferase (TIGR00027 family)
VNETQLDPVALTGRLVAALRAKESARPDRLFEDPFAERLAGPVGKALFDEFGDNATIAVRTRFFDDALATMRDIDQVVILAAGMDSRAYRLDLPAGTAVFELDRPEVLGLKERLLTGCEPRCSRHAVGVDLATDWTASLLGAGFVPERPTCWLVEGLTQYLVEPDVHGLLDRLTALSAPGGRLLLDVVGRSFLDSPAMRPMLDWFAARAMTWRFGTDEPEALVTGRGWRPEVTLISTAGNRLGRWPQPEMPRGTPGVGQGYLVVAER